MKYTATLIISLILMVIVAGSCGKKTTSPTVVAFYNVENLFDTIDDAHIRDERYVPDSDIKWGTERYHHKINNLAKVMSAIDSTGFPAIFGLCEVENKGVLEDLLKHTELSSANYQIVHKNSQDERGIDNALLYQKEYYKPIVNRYIQPIFPDSLKNKTRDILYSKGKLAGGETIHLFVNHWVSRWGGQAETEVFRIYLGQQIKAITDSILEVDAQANIIILGDLNDNPTDISILNHLGAQPVTEPLGSGPLHNLSLNMYREGVGSLYYKSWDMFDQVIVSTALLKGSNGLITRPKQSILMEDWMLYYPKKGDPRPNRTAAKNYYGGYSDHLPVFLTLESAN